MSIRPERGADLEVVARLEVELGRLADLAQDDRVLLGHPVRGRRGRGGWAGRAASSLAGRRRPARARPCRTRSSPSARRRVAISRSASASSPARLASPICFESVLRSAWASSTSAAARGGGRRARAARRPRSAAPRRASAGLDPLGVGADQLQVEHRRPGSGRVFWPGRGESSASWPAYLATNSATASASSPTTMFCGMIAPEKPPFWIAKRASSWLSVRWSGSGPASARRGCRCPGCRRRSACGSRRSGWRRGRPRRGWGRPWRRETPSLPKPHADSPRAAAITSAMTRAARTRRASY